MAHCANIDRLYGEQAWHECEGVILVQAVVSLVEIGLYLVYVGCLGVLGALGEEGKERR
jgi:hypothetical protein